MTEDRETGGSPPRVPPEDADTSLPARRPGFYNGANRQSPETGSTGYSPSNSAARSTREGASSLPSSLDDYSTGYLEAADEALTLALDKGLIHDLNVSPGQAEVLRAKVRAELDTREVNGR